MSEQLRDPGILDTPRVGDTPDRPEEDAPLEAEPTRDRCPMCNSQNLEHLDDEHCRCPFCNWHGLQENLVSG